MFPIWTAGLDRCLVYVVVSVTCNVGVVGCRDVVSATTKEEVLCRDDFSVTCNDGVAWGRVVVSVTCVVECRNVVSVTCKVGVVECKYGLVVHDVEKVEAIDRDAVVVHDVEEVKAAVVRDVEVEAVVVHEVEVESSGRRHAVVIASPLRVFSCGSP